MKSKRLQYILFPIVGFIWAYTFYKYFIYTPEQESAAPISLPAAPVEFASSTAEVDSFVLLQEYRDPFLGKVRRAQITPDRMPETQPKAPNPNPAPRKPAKPKEEPKPTDWSFLKFSGIVQQSGTDKKIGLLQVNGKMHRVEPGKMYGNVTVLALYADSVRVQFKEEEQTVVRR